MDIASRKQAFVRDEILNSATKLFAERGYRAVTIDDIVTSLGYTKSVVYYYFENKNEILWTIINRIFEGFIEKMSAARDAGGSPTEVLSRMIRQHALSVMENPEWTSIFNREEQELETTQRKQIRRMKREYDAAFEQVYRQGVANGSFRDIPAHVMINGALGMCNWLYVWFDPKGELTSEAIATHYATVLTSGWTAPKNGEN